MSRQHIEFHFFLDFFMFVVVVVWFPFHLYLWSWYLIYIFTWKLLSGNKNQIRMTEADFFFLHILSFFYFIFCVCFSFFFWNNFVFHRCYVMSLMVTWYINGCRYETGNGIKAEETGTLKKASSPDSNDAIIAQGLFVFFLFIFPIFFSFQI